MGTVGTVRNVPEAAEFLGLSERYLWRLIASGEFPHRRVGRRVLITEDDLAEFCDAHKAA